MAKPGSNCQISMQAAQFHDDAAGIPENHWCRLFFEHVFLRFDDAQFTDLYREGGRYPISPRMLACISILQFMQPVSDRQAVENTIMRRDWRIALGLTPDYDGFDPSVLCNFRKRLLAHGKAAELFQTVLQRVQALGLLKGTRKVRVDATILLADVAVLSRCDMISEAMRIVLRELPYMRPKIRRRAEYRSLHERYGEEIWLGRSEGGDERLKRLAVDAKRVLRLCGPYPVKGRETLERILEENFTFSDADEPTPKPPDALPPGHIATPHEPDAEIGKQRDKLWTGDKVHVVETTHSGEPGFLLDVIHTGPRAEDSTMLESILQRLKFIAPQVTTVLADSGYASAANSGLAGALGYDLISPPRVNNSKGIIPASAFELDFRRRKARCPEGHESSSWFVGRRLKIKFPRAVCAACPRRSECTTSPSEPRTLTLSPHSQQLMADRKRAARADFGALYSQRAGIEATISHLVRDCGLRRSRYRGSPKRALHAWLSATALNVRRLLRCLASDDAPWKGAFSVFSRPGWVLRRPPQGAHEASGGRFFARTARNDLAATCSI